MAQRYATVSLTADFLWSDGTPFNGALVFQCVMPLDQQYVGEAGQVITRVPTHASTYPQQQIPLWHAVPVREGKLATNARIWKNSAYNPRGTTYSFTIVDSSGKIVTGVTGAPSGLFTVSSDTYPLTLGAASWSTTDGTAQNLQIGDDAIAIGGAGTPGVPTVVFYSAWTLTTASTLITYPIQASGSILFLRITQDATGGRAVTYDTMFSNGDTNIADGANAGTFMIFYSDGTFWNAFTYNTSR